MSKMSRMLSGKMLLVLLMGFVSGLPLFLVGSTLQAWMKDAGVDLTVIGLFSLVGLPYTLKFLWAPLMDRYTVLPGLGRRRSWMLLSQILLGVSIVALGLSDPQGAPAVVAFLAVCVAFFSASQDIVLDAWRREALSDDELGLGSSTFVTGYLISMRLVAGALALILADHMPWNRVYLIMGALVTVGIATTLVAREPEVSTAPPRTLKESVVEPFVDFFSKSGAWILLAFILLYKIGDNMASAMTMPFYLELGFTKTDIAAVTKIFGWIATTVGGLVGGAIILKIKIKPALFWFGILQAISTLAFAALAIVGKSQAVLTAVIAFENLTAGMGTAAFVAFMATLTNKKFTATQYALLTSLMGVPRVIAAAPTGFLAKELGWTGFFVACTLIALPGMLLLKPIFRLEDKTA